MSRAENLQDYRYSGKQNDFLIFMLKANYDDESSNQVNVTVA